MSTVYGYSLYVCIFSVHPRVECADNIQIAVLQTCLKVRFCCRSVAVLIGCKDDEVAMLTHGEVGVKVEHKPLLRVLVVIVCASVVRERMPSSVSSSSCSTSDPHTHCPSTDLYTPNYTQQPHDSIHSSTPYVETINTHTEDWHIQTRSVAPMFRSPKSCCH